MSINRPVYGHLRVVSQAERAEAGRAAAKARGKSGGRPRTDSDKLEQARILYQNSDKFPRKVCELFGFSRRTLFSYMKMAQILNIVP